MKNCGREVFIEGKFQDFLRVIPRSKLGVISFCLAGILLVVPLLSFIINMSLFAIILCVGMGLSFLATGFAITLDNKLNKRIANCLSKQKLFIDNGKIVGERVEIVCQQSCKNFFQTNTVKLKEKIFVDVKLKEILHVSVQYCDIFNFKKLVIYTSAGEISFIGLENVEEIREYLNSKL